MGSFLITLIAGVVAGALTARQVARREVEALREQLARRGGEPAPLAPAAIPQKYETKPIAPKTAEPTTSAPAPEVSEGITPEILMVLSAAVAAFLGKKARIRRARVAPAASGSAWAQQGRVFIQASHILPHHH
jgi:methylmalonyl-CoA carboxyltransferase large subunit